MDDGLSAADAKVVLDCLFRHFLFQTKHSVLRGLAESGDGFRPARNPAAAVQNSFGFLDYSAPAANGFDDAIPAQFENGPFDGDETCS
jgi:hypothetical protein